MFLAYKGGDKSYFGYAKGKFKFFLSLLLVLLIFSCKFRMFKS